MILAANQPYFLPYIGYWQLINAADVFVMLDDYQYINRGWVNRNRILVGNKDLFWGLELDHVSQNKRINEIRLLPIQRDRKLKQLRYAYAHAPYYREGAALMERVYSCGSELLSSFLENSIRVVSDYLRIDTRFCRSSDFVHNDDYKREYRIYDLCERLGADTYINAIGGQALYSYEDFRNHGIRLAFLKTGDIRYRQFKNEFVPNLSILDVIMFNSVDDIRQMLTCCTLLGENRSFPLFGDAPEKP